MKSVLHEASSILKAIEKAWEASGKPSEFNVKVLEQGEKKLWVFTSKPAIVSISFDQKHVARTFKTTPQNNRFNKRSQAHSNNGATTQEKLLNGTSTPQLEAVTKNNVRSRQNQQRHQNANQQSQAKNQRQQPALRQQNQQSLAPVNEQQAQKQPRPTNQIIGWTPELVQFVAKELKDFLNIMNITIAFQEKVEQKTLTITFAQPPLDNKEDARLLYISLSYLLIQLTKKQEKKKLRDFHLIITAAA